MNKKLRLKRKWCFILGVLVALSLEWSIKSITNYYKNWYNECDNYYGYKTDYYTCRQFHNNK